MNLILLNQADFSQKDRVKITGRRHQYMKTVHRAQAGESLRVGVLDGKIGSGQILRIKDHETEMEVKLFYDPPKILPITLILPG